MVADYPILYADKQTAVNSESLVPKKREKKRNSTRESFNYQQRDHESRSVRCDYWLSTQIETTGNNGRFPVVKISIILCGEWNSIFRLAA